MTTLLRLCIVSAEDCNSRLYVIPGGIMVIVSQSQITESDEYGNMIRMTHCPELSDFELSTSVICKEE